MAWTAGNANTKLNARILKSLPDRSSHTYTTVIDGNQPAMTGIYRAGAFRKDGSGVRDANSTTLEVNEVVEVRKDYEVPSTVTGAEGSNEEAGEGYLLVNDASHTLMVLEVEQSIPAAVLPTTIDFVLKYKQTDASGTAAFQSTSTLQVNVTPSDTDATIAQKFLEALLAQANDSYGKSLVSCMPEFRAGGITGNNGEDTQFAAWIEAADGTNKDSVFIAALSHEQDIASLEFLGVSGGGGNPVIATNNITWYPSQSADGILSITDFHYEPTGSLRTNKIRDVRYNESSCGVSTHERDDLDVQSSLFRSAQGANQQYTSSAALLQPEIITPGVMRYATIEITPSTFANPTYDLLNNAVVALPWPDDSYYSEGPCILKDAFLELHTDFAAGSDTLQMDIGIDCPDLYPLQATYKSLGGLTSYRSFYGSVLRGLQVDGTVASETSQAGGNTLGTNTALPGVETFNFNHSLDSDYGSSAEVWMTAPLFFGNEGISSIGPFQHDVIIENWSCEYQHATASLGAVSSASPLIAKLYVLPSGTANTAANWVTLASLVDEASAMHKWTNSGDIVFQTASAAAGTIEVNNNIGIRLPAGYRLGVKFVYPSTTSLVSTGSGFCVSINTHRATTKGVALTGPQSILVDPFSAPTGSLIATISRLGTMEIDVTAPSGNTNIKTALTAGKAYLHLHFWQAKRKTTEIAWTQPSGGLAAWPTSW